MISVLIALSQDRGYLQEAIRSVEDQKFTGEWEIVIQQGPHLRGKNINDGFVRCKGEYIKLLDDDDILPPNCLADLHEGIQGFDWVCGDGLSFGRSDYLYVGRQPEMRGMLVRNHIHGGTTMYHRKCFEDTGGFDENLWTCEEYDFHLMLMDLGYKCNHVHKTVHHYRMWENNKSYLYNQSRRQERLALQEQIKNRYR